ncbi:MAG: hypothetical protein LUE98_01095 [Tannerellaceae bacterium]|nr:hypothetical protein [Tannerellaceae bacterium]
MKKNYKQANPQEKMLNEPGFSYQAGTNFQTTGHLLNLSERKAGLINSILNDLNDEELFNELERFYIELTHKEILPCQYSIEELNARTRLAIQQAKEGKITTFEDMMKRHTL